MVQMGQSTRWATPPTMAIHIFQGIGHMGADGTMRFISSSITSKAMVGVVKGVIYKNGTGIIKEWFWK
jgi:hypothetical protein